ncbi:MAG: CDF family Co(II)/Ni(II) efflux transporter DmeF [Alphaproteobacteria bacterium]|nr:CDF family Co(II)/Ni(II) efflux transporter DmeF [Alphaproteobacteria bacterium]
MRASQNLYCSHAYTTPETQKGAERKTLAVVILTFVMMVVEIGGGWITGSMALLADGWHMGTHAGALGLTLFAYYFARKHQNSPLYSFGTGKVTTLGGFASAVVLGVVALLIAFESVERLLYPGTIDFNEAILIAVIGLVVNLASAILLHGGHGDCHGHSHDHSHAHDHHTAHTHDHDHDHGHEDHNLRAAYLHVLADALTSVTAIAALLFGKYLGWNWMDPVMGVVGSLVIAWWSIGLLKATSRILLDRVPEGSLPDKVSAIIAENKGDKIADLHLWATAPGFVALVISITTSSSRTADDYKAHLAHLPGVAHITVEVNKKD